MIDEMMLAFDSPGSVSNLLIIALLSRSQKNARSRHLPETTECAARVFCALSAPNWLAAESVSASSACRLAEQ
jgi:hypothetical protein